MKRFTSPRTIRICTLVAASLHLIQAFVVLGLSWKNDTRVRLTQTYAAWPSDSTNPITHPTVSGGTIDLKFLIFSFFLLSALFQGFPAAVTPLWRRLFQSIQNKGIQPFRWIEYAASASCLLLACAVVDGTIDLHYLLVMFFTNAAIMLLGYVQEVFAYVYIMVKGSSGNRWEYLMPHLVGWLAYIPMWSMLLTKFALAVKHSDRSPPTTVFLLFIMNAIVFSSFGLVQLVEMLYIYSNPDRRPIYAARAEFAYTILSFTAKTQTAWFFYGGIIASSTFAKP
jgi:hypothetical protein